MNISNYKVAFTIFGFLMLGLLTMCSDEPKDNPDVILPANFIFEETFEGDTPFSTAQSKEIGDWDYALQYIDSQAFPVYKGKTCSRFEIREYEPLVIGGKRSEVVIVKGTEGQIGPETWYSFAVYLPTDGYEKDSTLDVISQWFKLGSPVRLLTKDDKFIIEIGYSKDIDKTELFIPGEILKDTWHTFIFHFKHYHDARGLVEVWHNDDPMISHSGGNLYTDDLPKWKIGINKSSFEVGTSQVTKRIIYFDNVRVGDENSYYDFMNPGND